MGMIGTRLVERLKETALRMGTQGVRLVVEGTVTAVRVMDQLQELLPKEERVKREPARGEGGEEHREEPALYRPIPARPLVGHPAKEVRAEARATAQWVLEEARAAQERLKKAQAAPQPLKVSAEMEEEPLAGPKRTARKTPRTQGRKTMATATAPKRATARPGGFKAKRGQKHGH